MMRELGALFACAAFACTPASPPTPVKGQQVQPPTLEPEAKPEPPRVEEPTVERPPPRVATPEAPVAITIEPRAQMFTTSGPPSHVWFEVKNAGAASSIEIVELAYEGGARAVKLKIDWIRLDDVEHSGKTVPVEAGSHVLDFGIVSGRLPSGESGYDFRLRAKVGGRDVEVESSVVFAHRDPIRR